MTIDNLSNLGQGIGRIELPDGSKWVVMVPFVLEGEEVDVRIFCNHKNYSEASLVKVLKPSPERITPLCPYFGRCGGCQYQHIPIDTQRRWKQHQVKELLTRIGGMPEVPVNNVVGTDELYHYRCKITPHYHRPKEGVDAEGNPTQAKLDVGFQQANSSTILDVDRCVIATDRINAKLTDLRHELHERLAKEGPAGFKSGATVLLRDCEEGVVTNSNELITQRVANLSFHFKAGEFFQNNPFILPPVVDHVRRFAQGDGCRFLIDAYCGSGLFGLSLANVFEHVYGVEISEHSVRFANANAMANGITNAEFLLGHSEAIFDKVQGKLPPMETTIILDPPRKGCDEVFLRQLFRFGPRKIVYVSCDPATQARDARIIVDNGYRIIDVTPFDFFPQTRHIENVIVFVPSDSHPTAGAPAIAPQPQP